MWERLIAWFHLLWDAGQKVESHSSAIDELQDSDHLIIQALQKLAMQNELLHKENEALHQELQHQRELHERDIRELKLELRLQISEALRQLPPAKDP